MTRREALEKMYKFLQDDYDLTRKEAKYSFEIQLIEDIFDDFEKEELEKRIESLNKKDNE